ncbi:hypothetical protein EDM00_07670 [Ornithobacterium rhinotracheale]|uniref:hypothetical protein n=1 Tax=Ornithobacterium rhinotracheale TaxID=28251 RepID=UPI00129C7EE7|nr:hypothetical protein [Ornithobacterium rhinotracheale]MRI63865.1 hypothetical protein [Ornithobacterium rhinotracheale]
MNYKKCFLITLASVLLLSCQKNQKSPNESKVIVQESATEKISKKLALATSDLEKIILNKELIAEELKTMSKTQADSLYLSSQNLFSSLLQNLIQSKKGYLENYYEYHHNAEGQEIPPPSPVEKTEEEMSRAGIETYRMNDGKYNIRYDKDFLHSIFKGHLSSQFQGYLSLQEKTQDEIVYIEGDLATPWDELGELVAEYEKYIKDFPGTKWMKKATKDYLSLQQIYLLGTENCPIITGDGNFVENVQEEFDRFSKFYPQSPTTKLIKKLEKNKKDSQKMFEIVQKFQDQTLKKEDEKPNKK